MEQVKTFSTKFSTKLPIFFLIGAGIAILNTLSRADYNVLLYLYMYYVWKHMHIIRNNQAKEKVATFCILLFSWLIDFIWCFFWSSKWGSLKNDAEHFVHTLGICLSWWGILMKIIILLLTAFIEWRSIKEITMNKSWYNPFTDEGTTPAVGNNFNDMFKANYLKDGGIREIDVSKKKNMEMNINSNPMNTYENNMNMNMNMGYNAGNNGNYYQ